VVSTIAGNSSCKNYFKVNHRTWVVESNCSICFPHGSPCKRAGWWILQFNWFLTWSRVFLSLSTVTVTTLKVIWVERGKKKIIYRLRVGTHSEKLSHLNFTCRLWQYFQDLNHSQFHYAGLTYVYLSLGIFKRNDKPPQFSVSLLRHREIKIVKIFKQMFATE